MAHVRTTSREGRRGRRRCALVTGCGDSSTPPATGRAGTRAPAHASTTPTRSRRPDLVGHQSPPAAAAAAPAGPCAARPARRTPAAAGHRGYVRDAFGSDWVDTDHDGCNQRDDVLLRDAVPGTTRSRSRAPATTTCSPAPGTTRTPGAPSPSPTSRTSARPRRSRSTTSSRSPRPGSPARPALEPRPARGVRQRPPRAARRRRPHQHEQGRRRPGGVATAEGLPVHLRAAVDRDQDRVAPRRSTPRRPPRCGRCSAPAPETL